MASFRICTIFLLFALPVALTRANGGDDWAALALRLSGESAASYERVVARLRKIPQLEEKLRGELSGGNKYLAMDVISALGLGALLPDLAKESATDETGLSYNAINALLTRANEKSIASLYQSRVFSREASPAARVVMWDTMGRLGTQVDLKMARAALTDDPSPEVRAAVLYYVRLVLLHRRMKEVLPLIGAALASEPFQLRVQALYLVSELAVTERAGINAANADCARDPEPEVRGACLTLFPGGTWAK